MGKKDTSLMVLIGGWSGSYAAPSRNHPVFDPDAPRQVVHQPFRREIYGGLTTSIGFFFLGPDVDVYIAVDAGLGIGPVSEFALDMVAARGRAKARLVRVFTHYHPDHFSDGQLADAWHWQPTPVSYYSPDLRAHCCSPNGTPPKLMTAQEHLEAYFHDAFAVRLEMLDKAGSVRTYHTFTPGESFLIEGVVQVDTMEGRHPNGVALERFTFPGHGRYVFATDNEPSDEPDDLFIRFCSGAEWVGVDMQYDDSEYGGRKALGRGKPQSLKGRGHGTPELVFGQLLHCDPLPKWVCGGHFDPNRSDMQTRLFEERTEVFLECRGALNRMKFSFAREGAVYWF